MAHIILPRRFTKQPQHAVELRGDLGIVSCFNGNLFDIKRKTKLSPSGTFTLAASSAGIGVKSDGNAGNKIPVSGTSNTTFTIFGVITPHSVTSFNFIMDADDSIPTTNRDLQLRLDTTSLTFVRFNTSESAVTATVTSAAAIGVPLNFVAVSNGAEVSLYCQKGSNKQTLTGTPSTWDETGYWFSRPSEHTASTAYGLNGIIHLGGYASKAWSERDALEFVKNPWRVFSPRKQVIYFDVSTGLPTLSASTYKPGTLTSTGWTPRITAS